MGGSPTCFHEGFLAARFCFSCPHPGPPLHSAALQCTSIQNTILVHHPAATVHQSNPAQQSPRRVSTSSQYLSSLQFNSCNQYPTLSWSTSLLNRDSHFYEGSVVRNSFTSFTGCHENQMVECCPHTPGSYAPLIHWSHP